MATPGNPVLHSDTLLKYLIPVPILTVIALALCIVRIWTRVKRTRKLYADDWLIVVAEVLSLTNFALACATFAHGWGHPISTFTPAEVTATMRLQFASGTVWVVTLCFVRLSIAASLLRFGNELLWRGVLYGLMTFQVLISSGYIVMQFAACTPITSNWENVPDVKCWPVKPIIIYGWIIGGVYIIMDLTLALMPIKLIRSLTRPLTEKILIGILMATGLLATGVLCAKLSTYPTFGKGDPMQATVEPAMWTKLEELCGIIASCLPSLKEPGEKVLRRIGVLTTRLHNTLPSFVNSQSISLQRFSKGRTGGGEGSRSQLGKDDVSNVSVSVRPENLSIKKDNEEKGWEAV